MMDEQKGDQARSVLQHILQHLTIGAVRKKTFALRAEKEGSAPMARIFRVLAASDDAQRRRALHLLHGPIAATRENVREILTSQLPELQELYRDLLQEAEQAGHASLSHLADQEGRVSRKNAMLLEKAVKKAAAPRCFVCSFCGYIHENEAPERCPVCQAPRRRFVEVG